MNAGRAPGTALCRTARIAASKGETGERQHSRGRPRPVSSPAGLRPASHPSRLPERKCPRRDSAHSYVHRPTCQHPSKGTVREPSTYREGHRGRADPTEGAVYRLENPGRPRVLRMAWAMSEYAYLPNRPRRGANSGFLALHLCEETFATSAKRAFVRWSQTLDNPQLCRGHPDRYSRKRGEGIRGNPGDALSPRNKCGVCSRDPKPPGPEEGSTAIRTHPAVWDRSRETRGQTRHRPSQERGRPVIEVELRD